MNKKLWIVANFKSNMSLREVLDWVEVVGPRLDKRDDRKYVVCPTATAIAEIKKAVLTGNFPLIVGSQNLSPFEEGAYTGEEAASILKQFVKLSIIGHSERREKFGESDEMVELKSAQALANEILPLVCVQNEHTPVPDLVKLIAYEPVFAIGSGKADSPQNANQVALKLIEKYPGIEVLYGGSVNAENCKGFLSEEYIAGLLVGKASLDPEEFLEIIDQC